MQPREQPHRLLVGGEMGMDRAVDADFAEAKNRMVARPFLEQRDQLVAQPLRREVADESHVNAAPGKPLGVVVHAEATGVARVNEHHVGQRSGLGVDEEGGDGTDHRQRARSEEQRRRQVGRVVAT